MRPKRVILHCSDTPDSNGKYTAQDIDGWHRARGMSQIGYHDVIRRDGLREFGRANNIKGAHTFGENHDSLGVCYIGRMQPSVAQIKTILEIYQDYLTKFGIAWSAWHGHNEFNPHKTCPGISMDALRLLLSNFDARDFTLDDCPDPVRRFLQVCAVGSNK